MSEISPRDPSLPVQHELEAPVMRSYMAPAAQPEQPTDAHRLATAPELSSERVIVAAPLSFAGSAQRIWRMTGQSVGLLKVGLATIAIFTILTAWTFVLSWYLVFGLWLVPYRIVRRGQRKSKKQALQHREMLAAIERQNRR